MNHNTLRRIITIISLILSFTIDAHSTSWEGWRGKAKDVSIITSDDLIEYFESHEQWLKDNNIGKRFDLSDADLSGVDLGEVNLSGAILRGANLSNTNLSKSNLTGANLSGANLTESTLYWTNLAHADLNKANFLKADLAGAILSGANLRCADLSEADISGASIVNANLTSARLIRTNLEGANLTGSIFKETNIDNSRFSNANFKDVKYDLIIGSPSKNFVGGMRGIETITFSSEDGHSGISVLRKLFQENGLRDSERRATFAIEHGKTEFQHNIIEKYFRIIFFEWTCGYGLYYGRPLTILASLIILFSSIYTISIAIDYNDGHLYKVWNKERIPFDIGSDEPEIVRKTGTAAIGIALYFSTLSACRIGWRELNFGHWLVNMQRHEYFYKATGWVRTVSGIQSLVSVYLLALWVLTYFGRPFE